MVPPGSPAVKSPHDTDASQSAPKPRSSVTWTGPRFDSITLPGGPAPRSALAGAVMVSVPLTMLEVTVHGPPASTGQLLPASAEVTVLVMLVPPSSGLS